MLVFIYMEEKKGYFIFDFGFLENLESETRELSLAERCVISYIKGWEKGYYGSQKTLSQRLGLSERTVNRTIAALLRDGFLTKEGKFLFFNKDYKDRKEVKNVEEDEEWLKLMSAIAEGDDKEISA
ncbi:MAG: HTH domain-containing protein [Bacteroidales bacterium]|nr:HTH domain-containing protein [Bacteroidales bacterium]